MSRRTWGGIGRSILVLPVVFAVIFGLQWSMVTDRTVLTLVLILVLVLLTVLIGVQVFKGFRGILRQGEEEARENPRPW